MIPSTYDYCLSDKSVPVGKEGHLYSIKYANDATISTIMKKAMDKLILLNGVLPEDGQRTSTITLLNSCLG